MRKKLFPIFPDCVKVDLNVSRIKAVKNIGKLGLALIAAGRCENLGFACLKKIKKKAKKF